MLRVLPKLAEASLNKNVGDHVRKPNIPQVTLMIYLLAGNKNVILMIPLTAN